MINPKTKGASGEREICDMLNADLVSVMSAMNTYDQAQINKAWSSVQRNQNQSAVGGNDLTNTFGLSIEVKRQEALSVNTWWKQSVAAADRNKEVPVLIYRQNRKAWRVVMLTTLFSPTGKGITVRSEFDMEAFRAFWKLHVRECLETGWEVRS